MAEAGDFKIHLYHWYLKTAFISGTHKESVLLMGKDVHNTILWISKIKCFLLNHISEVFFLTLICYKFGGLDKLSSNRL